MTELWETLVFYFNFPFVRYAMIVGVLIALCSSLLGVTLVLKRVSYIGDGLSHVAFGTLSVATVLKLTNLMILVLPVTIICAILLLKNGQNVKIKGDAAIAMMSVSSMSLGYLLLNVFSTSANLAGDVCSTLFGATSILTLKKSDVWLCLILSFVVVLSFSFLYHKIFNVTFDETFAQSVGTPVSLYNTLIAVVTAAVVVLAMNLVGSLLVSALIVFPALASMRVFHHFKAVTICAAVFSVTCTAVGIIISILAGTPVGPTIVTVDMLGFFVFALIGKGRSIS